MKAMVLESPGRAETAPLHERDVSVPEPGPGEILIRIRCCGVCHTDLHTVEGELPGLQLPRIPGHEIVGVVDSVGEGAARFAVGDKVGAAWLHEACGECAFCLSGRENLCLKARFTGYQVDGGYAEFMRIPEKFAYRLPTGFSDEEAAPLLCSGIIGYRALCRSGIKPGGVLGLYGFGASAHVAIQIARHWGCKVYVFTRGEGHRAHARELGAAWTGSALDNPPAKLDAAILFAPAGELVPQALRVLERGGTVASAGIHMSPIPELDYQGYLYHEKTLTSVANATRKDGEELLRLAAEIPIRTTVSRFPLAEANHVLQTLKGGAITGAAVLRI
jgi:alcohol dehydrogenase, propanol-preferring